MKFDSRQWRVENCSVALRNPQSLSSTAWFCGHLSYLLKQGTVCLLYVNNCQDQQQASESASVASQHSPGGLIEILKIYIHDNSLQIPNGNQKINRYFLENVFAILTYLLTPWIRVLPEKLKRPELLKKFPAFYGTRRFITALTRAYHRSLSWAGSIQSMPPHPNSLKIHFNIIIPSTPGSSKWSPSLRFPH
jgi:hypothetical protein